MTTRYKNSNAEYISQQQATELDEYYACYFEGDQLTREETYLNGDLYGVTHINFRNEPHQQILHNSYTSNDLAFCIVDQIAYKNGYMLEKLISYDDKLGSLVGRTNSLYDLNKDLVGFERFLETSEIPDYQGTLKYYYDRSISPNEYLFEGIYDQGNGEFQYLHFNQHHTDPTGHDSFSLENTPADIAQLKEITGMQSELMEYYFTAKVVPNFDTLRS